MAVRASMGGSATGRTRRAESCLMDGPKAVPISVNGRFLYIYFLRFVRHMIFLVASLVLC